MPLKLTFYQSLPSASEGLLRYMLELIDEEQARVNGEWLAVGERLWYAVRDDGSAVRLTGEEEIGGAGWPTPWSGVT